MKPCPFCKEEIRDDAIKCRYCASSLLPPQTETAPAALPAAGKDQVVYILDQGLIRFGKFAGAILAIFVAVGIYLYGVDIKEALKGVEDSTKTAQDSAKNADKAKADVAAAEADAKNQQAALIKMVAETQGKLDNLMKQVETASQQAEAASRDAETKAKTSSAQIDQQRQEVENIKQQSAALLQSAKEIVAQVTVERQAFEARIALPGPTTGQQSSESSNAGTLPAEGSSSGTAPKLEDRPFSLTELAELYHFPAGTDGSGQTVALIELGGGYRQADLAAFFKSLGVRMPTVVSVPVDGGRNDPSTTQSADGVVALNIEAVGGAAPGAKIAVYFAPNTSVGFLDAIEAVVHDRTYHPSILCITWGEPESTWEAGLLPQMNHALQDAATAGITVLAASGDTGPTDGVQDGKSHVDFPGSSPWVTSVGGTAVHAESKKIVAEAAWNDTGGLGSGSGWGISSVFAAPEWQSATNVPASTEGFRGRGLPDVVIDAAPSTGYLDRVDGEQEVVGGTAAATPLWAALIARVNQALGHNVGFLNPVLYQKLGPAGVLRAVPETPGTEASHARWNKVTGWGAPDGELLLEALRKQ